VPAEIETLREGIIALGSLEEQARLLRNLMPLQSRQSAHKG
jgi:hypothetical protein